jgi:hypothetical protein
MSGAATTDLLVDRFCVYLHIYFYVFLKNIFGLVGVCVWWWWWSERFSHDVADFIHLAPPVPSPDACHGEKQRPGHQHSTALDGLG